ncbi:MAG: non-homologous end-joining DNA ligase [Gaiellaceae bacterium]
MRTAVLGPGTVGGALAVRLGLVGESVICVARPEAAAAIRDEGLTHCPQRSGADRAARGLLSLERLQAKSRVSFVQKDAPKHMPDWIRTRSFEVSTRDRKRRRIDVPLVDDELALLWQANMACIDLNTWYSRVDKPDRPDWVLFDLDPSPDVGFPEVVEVAQLVKSLLDGLGLASYPKTSGADGMHVLVPIARRSTYTATREFAEIVARTLASTHRGLVTTEWSKAKRRGVLIDANQNAEGKTIASAYSVRPVPGATVSTPLRWEEVRDGLDPAAFTMDAVLRRVATEGDLFADLLAGGQSLAKALASVR